MKVILLQEVKDVGKKDEIIEVSEGYARNYLLPRKIAVEATSVKLLDLKHSKDRESKKKATELQTAKLLGEKIAGLSLTITAKAGENGKLFGAVTTKEIAEQLQKIHGIAIDKRKMELKDPIKSVGEYSVIVKIHAEVHVPLKFDVKG